MVNTYWKISQITICSPLLTFLPVFGILYPTQVCCLLLKSSQYA